MNLLDCFQRLAEVAFAGGERGSRVSQFVIDFFCERVRTTEHAPCDRCRLLERRYGLVDIVERGTGVLAERRRINTPHFEREFMTFTESASRHGNRFAQ